MKQARRILLPPRQWWQSQPRTTRHILGILVIMALASCALGAIIDHDWPGLLLNFGTEIGGSLVTFALIDHVVDGHEEQEQLKKDLTAKLGSQVTGVAVAAAEGLRFHGWLTDGTLRGASLDRAGLENAPLSEAHLQRVLLWKARLSNADLRAAKLQGANLGGADLQGAQLSDANLEGAFMARTRLNGANLANATLDDANLREVDLREAELVEASLRGTDLTEADLAGGSLAAADLEGAILASANLQAVSLANAGLQGANLLDANFQGVRLGGALFDERTILPDGTRWAPGTEMARFTSPQCPEFWKSPVAR